MSYLYGLRYTHPENDLTMALREVKSTDSYPYSPLTYVCRSSTQKTITKLIGQHNGTMYVRRIYIHRTPLCLI